MSAWWEEPDVRSVARTLTLSGVDVEVELRFKLTDGGDEVLLAERTTINGVARRWRDFRVDKELLVYVAGAALVGAGTEVWLKRNVVEWLERQPVAPPSLIAVVRPGYPGCEADEMYRHYVPCRLTRVPREEVP